MIIEVPMYSNLPTIHAKVILASRDSSTCVVSDNQAIAITTIMHRLSIQYIGRAVSRLSPINIPYCYTNS